MLLNPIAAKRLKDVTAYNYWPNTTHEQRNELARMFNEEAGRLLDRQSESTIKHTVELYCTGEISYEQYIERIEQVSQEEAIRGAAYGETYARNQVFDFAQKALDRAQDHAHALSLTDAKKQYELEKQKSEQSIKAILQQYVTTLENLTQQHDTDIQNIAEKQKGELLYNQQSIIEQTKAEIEQIMVKRLQDERERQEKDLHEQEESRPAREAARTAAEHVALLERKVQTHQQGKYILVGLGCVLFLVLVLLLLFFPLPQWTIVILLAVIAAIFVTSFLWKSTISEEQLATYRRQIALYQTKSEEYASLSDEERSALLVQRVL